MGRVGVYRQELNSVRLVYVNNHIDLVLTLELFFSATPLENIHSGVGISGSRLFDTSECMYLVVTYGARL